MLRAYPGFTWESLLQLPVKRFWFLNRQIDRLRAEEDLRQIRVMGAVTGEDLYKKTVESLESSMGTVFVTVPATTTLNLADGELDPEFDRAAFHALKAKIRANT